MTLLYQGMGSGPQQATLQTHIYHNIIECDNLTINYFYSHFPRKIPEFTALLQRLIDTYELVAKTCGNQL